MTTGQDGQDDAHDGQGELQQETAIEPSPPVEEPTPAPLLALDQGDVFKVPALPTSAPAPAVTSPSATLRALPADIEHILSLGANAPDEAERAAAAGGRTTSELEQVVRELKEKALRADKEGEVKMEDGGDLTKSDELRKVEDEMRSKGVTRDAEVGEADAEEGEVEETVASAASTVKQEQKVVKMEDDDSSDSDSSSSSSDSDDTTAAPAARQRNRRGKQRADSDLDDDEDSGVASSKTAPKTEHEVIEPDVAPPPVEKLDEGAQLAKFGKVESVIETVVVVKADTGGDWRVLDEGTVVCWEDRTVIGTIFETFGSVQQPFYSIRFPASSPPDPTVFTQSRAVFYSPNLASFVFTRDLRNMKGSDASNIWDEEVGANEVEFSDDEEEAEYKRRLKADRRARTQSATPGPSASRASRAPSSAASAAPPSFPPANLPARPAVSYADTADDFLVPSVPSAAPMNAPAPNRAMMGTAPPPGRVGRRMFERDSGARLEEGEEVEFEFSSGEGSGDEDDAASAAGSEGGAARGGAGGRGGRGGRGGARGGQRGSAPAGPRGRGRGRGAAANSPGGRPIAGMPRGRVPSGPGPGAAGLPSKPAFQADFAMADAATAEGSGRMSAAPTPAGPAGGSPHLAAAQPAPFAFGAPSSGSFAFGAPQGPSATRSPPMQHPHAPLPPSGPRASWSGPPSSSSSSSGPPPASHGYSPNYPSAGQPPAGPAASAYGYRAPPPASAYYNGPPPPAGPSAYSYPSAPGAGAGGYSPHAPYAAPPPRGGAGPSEGYNPISVQGGGHLNPRFLAAQQAAAQHQGQRGAPGPQGYYPPPGAPGAPQGGQGQGGYGGQGRW
ncbi:hypothetical protein JCM10450v2_002441 [Rhodotorula kratochvilovae]